MDNAAKTRQTKHSASIVEMLPIDRAGGRRGKILFHIISSWGWLCARNGASQRWRFHATQRTKR
jgi:hypothetical protein